MRRVMIALAATTITGCGGASSLSEEPTPTPAAPVTSDAIEHAGPPKYPGDAPTTIEYMIDSAVDAWVVGSPDDCDINSELYATCPGSGMPLYLQLLPNGPPYGANRKLAETIAIINNRPVGMILAHDWDTGTGTWVAGAPGDVRPLWPYLGGEYHVYRP